MDSAETGHFHNDPEPRELKLPIRDDEDHYHQGNEGGEILAAVAHLKEIGLRLEAVFLSSLPNLRKNVERNHIRQRLVTQNVQCRSTFGVRPAAGPEKCEGGIDLSGHQQPDQQHTEASAADDPLLQIHLAV